MQTALPTAKHSKKRARPNSSSSSFGPLRCHVVDDHCDALKYIHKAIRRGALPFSRLRMMHFDAHPDLMVTPDMPADVCFRPHDLYEALGQAEGGIAEWILPLVFQGHLSKLWWIRPPWAEQFLDGGYRFCVGKVKDTGKLRVSSTAPYFVDDRLYRPEIDMQDSKPLVLLVSTVAPLDRNSSCRKEDYISAVGVSTARESRTTATTATSKSTTLPTSSAPIPNTVAYASSESNSSPERAGRREVIGVCCSGVGRTDAEDLGSTCRDCETRVEDSLDLASMATTRDGGAAEIGIDVTEVEEARPWVLDICLDYFTTENPFAVELESVVGKENTAIVREFYRKPLFRGADTQLSHKHQVGHERVFKAEVSRLLGVRPACEGGEESIEDIRRAGPNTAANESSRGHLIAENGHHCENGVSHLQVKPASTTPLAEGAAQSYQKVMTETDDSRTTSPGLARLKALFDQNSENDRLLVERFAAMLTSMGPKEREMIAWVDHCACLPRHLATREEVSAAVSKVEDLLRSVMVPVKGGDWGGLPGVITVARSDDDGYVPRDIAAFVEHEVLTMLKRLFGGRNAGSIKVLYDDGLESKEA